MNYYFDTEFIEGFHKPLFGRRRHFIDLISIGIVAENGREYYAISSEFKVRDADDWVRQNVLCPMVTNYLRNYVIGGAKMNHPLLSEEYVHDLDKSIRWIQNTIGKSTKQIAAEIQCFTAGHDFHKFYNGYPATSETQQLLDLMHRKDPPIFYAYYADYDWVLFCSLFGRMIDLPKGYPMYCRDLKQMLDELGLDDFWKDQNVPTSNEHNALDDARWNKRLYDTMKVYGGYKGAPTISMFTK